MSDGKPQDQPPDPRVGLAEERTDLAMARTRLAADRTLMAWMRTAVSLFGFGFSIYKFFQYLQQSGLAGAGWQPHAPRFLAMALIGMGLVFLLVALFEYRRFLRRLGEKARHSWPTLTAAFLLWGLGLAALIAVIFRLGPI